MFNVVDGSFPSPLFVPSFRRGQEEEEEGEGEEDSRTLSFSADFPLERRMLGFAFATNAQRELFTFLADSGMVVSLLYIGTSRSLTLLLILGARESERPPSGTVRCVGLSGCDSAM